jgi:hypothetical protein
MIDRWLIHIVYQSYLRIIELPTLEAWYRSMRIPFPASIIKDETHVTTYLVCTLDLELTSRCPIVSPCPWAAVGPSGHYSRDARAPWETQNWTIRCHRRTVSIAGAKASRIALEGANNGCPNGQSSNLNWCPADSFLVGLSLIGHIINCFRLYYPGTLPSGSQRGQLIQCDGLPVDHARGKAGLLDCDHVTYRDSSTSCLSRGGMVTAEGTEVNHTLPLSQ